MELEGDLNRLFPNKRLNEKYGLVPRPASYRPAKLLCDRMQEEAPRGPSYEQLLSLSEKDHSFCHRLNNDKAFHAIFSKKRLLGSKWKPNSTEEMEAGQQIDNAIRSRVELVIAQKVYLGQHYHELSDESEKTQIMKEVTAELAYMPQWLDLRPSHRALYNDILEVATLDYEATNVVTIED